MAFGCVYFYDLDDLSTRPSLLHLETLDRLSSRSFHCCLIRRVGSPPRALGSLGLPCQMTGFLTLVVTQTDISRSEVRT